MPSVKTKWGKTQENAEDLIIDNIEFDLSSATTQRFQKGTYYTFGTIDLLGLNLKNPTQLFRSFKPLGSIKATTGIKGWKVGDSINNLTLKGNIPSWSTVRQRHWKNRAYYHPKKYTKQNLERMEKGLAEQRINALTGKLETKELHHFPAQKDGGLFDFNALWPDEHAFVDPYRHLGG